MEQPVLTPARALVQVTTPTFGDVFIVIKILLRAPTSAQCAVSIILTA